MSEVHKYKLMKSHAYFFRQCYFLLPCLLIITDIILFVFSLDGARDYLEMFLSFSYIFLKLAMAVAMLLISNTLCSAFFWTSCPIYFGFFFVYAVLSAGQCSVSNYFC